MIEKFKIPDGKTVNITKRTSRNSSMHWHEFYELELCLEGNAKTVINKKEHKIKKGTVVLLTPSDLHKYETTEDMTLLNLTFMPEAIEYSGFLEKLYPVNYIIGDVDENTLKRLSDYIYQIKAEAENGGAFRKKYISLLLSCIFVELLRIGNANTVKADTSEKYDSIQKAVYFTRTHFKEPITLGDVAEFVGISPTALSKSFAKKLGVGFKDYLIDLRLNYAKQLIAQTDSTITDIAYSSGFNSLSYFQNVFIKKFDITPKNYRIKKSNQ